ncbi:hypothetical protein M3194_23135 [Paenibacillus glycanilyticus]|uniref:hypothetical protein n=1 Tax=Paenibacillus glycanilyticus TaxID=126569 RepID=UPI0020412D81|nr:hypothetical protein [Paenibacillus glycanilyticus]MCM3630233.1 hypothetical protein [Paenibacillus glycanilyticus]
MEKNLGHPFQQKDNYTDELTAAYYNIPIPMRSSSNVAAEVISRLLEENESFSNHRNLSYSVIKRSLFTRVAVMLCLFLLVGGTCYAAYSGYMLPLRDKLGHTTLQVAPTDIPSTPIEEIQILNRVRDGLKDGEQAVVYIGQTAILEENGKVLPQKGSHYTIVVKPLEFDTPEHMNDYLLGRGITISLPLSNWKGWSLRRTELQNDISSKSSYKRNWNTTYDEDSGKKYIYAVEPSGTKPQSLSWFYNKADEEIILTVSLDIPVLPTFYDSHPSSESILEIKGVDTYFYRDTNGSEKSIHWSEKVAEGNYRSFSVTSHSTDENELRKFATAVIAHND